MTRAALTGLVAFGLAALLLGGVLGVAVSGSPQSTAVAVGAVAAALGGAAGGLVGAWQARTAGLRGPRALLAAVLGPLAGAVLLFASAPQASLAALGGLAAVAVGALAGASLRRRTAAGYPASSSPLHTVVSPRGTRRP
jgi:hypothetical protein